MLWLCNGLSCMKQCEDIIKIPVLPVELLYAQNNKEDCPEIGETFNVE